MFSLSPAHGQASGPGILTREEWASLSEASSTEEAAAVCVRWMIRVTRAAECHAYIWSPEQHEYRLGASCWPASVVRPLPEYSGLLAGAPVHSFTPLVLGAAEAPTAPVWTGQSGALWLVTPCDRSLILRAKMKPEVRRDPALLLRVTAFAAAVAPSFLPFKKAWEASETRPGTCTGT